MFSDGHTLSNTQFAFRSIATTRQNRPTGYQLFTAEGQTIYPTLMVDWVELEGPILTDADKQKRDGIIPAKDSDIAAARAVWERDHELDEMYDSLFRELLTYMIEDPRNISPCTHLLFVAKNIERIGDLATNIAEIIHFQVEGRMIEDDRPKVDEASTTVVSAPVGRGL